MRSCRDDGVEERICDGDAKPRLVYAKPRLRVYGSVSDLTTGGTGTGTDSTGMMMRFSDPALKENIVAVGRLCNGLTLYLFDYRRDLRDALGRERQFGVMADEVERVMPEAVSRHEDGMLQVDYDLLGIRVA